MDFTAQWSRIGKLIASHERFLITSHKSPDGDALGCELAVYELLVRLGKSARIFNSCRPRRLLAFLNHLDKVETDPEQFARLTQEWAEVLFVLDMSRLAQSSFDSTIFTGTPAVKVCIDHHPYSCSWADEEIIDPEAAANAELVFELMQHLGYALNRPMAEALYTGILTDTHCFQAASVRSRTYAVAGELLQHGISHRRIYGLLFQRFTPNQLRLLGESLASLHTALDGRLAWFAVSHERLRALHIKPEDLDGYNDYPNAVGTVEMVIMLLELGPAETKISLRGKHNLRLDHFAELLGGGGHENAATAILPMSLAKARRKVIPEARQWLQPQLAELSPPPKAAQK